MTIMPVIDPRLAGRPPERHAARIVAEMASWLAGERARLSDEADGRVAPLGWPR